QRLYADATYRMLMAAAYGKLGTTGAELDTPEAVVQEAMSELTKRARGGRLEGVDSRERLFGLLRLIVAEKARDFRTLPPSACDRLHPHTNAAAGETTPTCPPDEHSKSSPSRNEKNDPHCHLRHSQLSRSYHESSHF
ncbi:MAG: hypothetical protein ACKPHU_19905, partial [Planctomycetaceae bacterium]